MRKVLIILMILISGSALADGIPKKFKNPLFNHKMQLQGRAWRDFEITPTFIKDFKTPEYSSKCEFITEDDKAIFLKCRDLTSDNDQSAYYEFYFIKYRLDQLCNIWNCSFWYYKNELRSPGRSVLSSSAADCEDELNEADIRDPRQKYPQPDCIQELYNRGWEKYLPAMPQE